MRLPVSQLKRLVKSRAGRIAELQMEIKILEGIIDRKVREGDLGGSARSASPEKAKPAARPAEKKAEEKAEPAPEKEGKGPSEEPEQTKINDQSSSHAFREID